MNEIEVGQVWENLDDRNAGRTRGGKVVPRTVEIVSLPTITRKGVMKVLQAPQNSWSVGLLREFTRAELLGYYGRVR